MTFTRIGDDTYGGHESVSLPKDFSGEVLYDKILAIELRDAYKEEEDKRPKLHTTWYFTLFHKGAPMFKSKCRNSFNIDGYNSTPTDEELKQLVNATFSILQKRFNKAKEAHPILREIPDLSEEEFQKYLSDIKKTLSEGTLQQTL